MAVGYGSSRPTDVADLRSSEALLPEIPLITPAIIYATTYVSAQVTTEATDDESGAHIEDLHMDTFWFGT